MIVGVVNTTMFHSIVAKTALATVPVKRIHQFIVLRP